MAWKDSGIGEDDTGDFEGEFWEPITGDVLEGDVVETPKIGKFDKLFMKVQDSEGTIWVTSQHAHLARQIKALHITEGDTVRITYLGQAEAEADSTYSPPHLYKLQKWEE